MNIGLDLDDTICSTDKILRKYVDNYCKYNDIDVEDLWKDEEKKCDFLTNNLKKIYSEAPLKIGAKQTINTLRNHGNKIYVITARRNKYIDMSMEEFIINYLNKKGIVVDKVIIDAKDKVDACLNNNIDYMVEDNSYNYELMVDRGINVILFDELDKHKDIKNRITKWRDLLSYIK